MWAWPIALRSSARAAAIARTSPSRWFRDCRPTAFPRRLQALLSLSERYAGKQSAHAAVYRDLHLKADRQRDRQLDHAAVHHLGDAACAAVSACTGQLDARPGYGQPELLRRDRSNRRRWAKFHLDGEWLQREQRIGEPGQRLAYGEHHGQ